MTFEAFLLWSAAFQMFFPVPVGDMCPLGHIDLGPVDVQDVNMCPMESNAPEIAEMPEEIAHPAQPTADTTQAIQQPSSGNSVSETSSSSDQPPAGSTQKVRDLLAQAKSTGYPEDE